MKLRKSKSIYVIHNSKVGIVKLGVSNNVNSRISTIKCSSGMNVDLLYVTSPIYNYDEIESKIHSEFEENRGIGEWFHIDPNEAIEYLLMIKHNFKVDGIYQQWREESNISLLSREFGVSRAAIKKHLDKHDHSLNIDLNKKKEEILKPKPIKIREKNEVKDIPHKSKKVDRNVYEFNGDYYMKIWKQGKFTTTKHRSLQEAVEARPN